VLGYALPVVGTIAAVKGLTEIGGLMGFGCKSAWQRDYPYGPNGPGPNGYYTQTEADLEDCVDEETLSQIEA